MFVELLQHRHELFPRALTDVELPREIVYLPFNRKLLNAVHDLVAVRLEHRGVTKAAGDDEVVLPHLRDVLDRRADGIVLPHVLLGMEADLRFHATAKTMPVPVPHVKRVAQHVPVFVERDQQVGVEMLPAEACRKLDTIFCRIPELELGRPIAAAAAVM